MAASTDRAADDSLYPIAVLIDELKNEDIQVSNFRLRCICEEITDVSHLIPGTRYVTQTYVSTGVSLVVFANDEILFDFCQPALTFKKQ